MRIAFITHYTNLYGANRSLLNLLDGLKQFDVIPYVITPEEGLITEELFKRDITYDIFPVKKWMSKNDKAKNLLSAPVCYLKWAHLIIFNLLYNLYSSLFLVHQFKKWGIQLIYTNSSVIPIGAMVAKFMKLPHIWHVRELGVLHYGYQYHYGKKTSKNIIKSADAIIAISEIVRRHLLDGKKNSRVKVIYNGVAWESDFDRYRQKAKRSPAVGTLYTFAIIGLIHPNKGQETAVRALAEVSHFFPNVRLLIVGGGNYHPVKELSVKLNVVDKIEFVGFVTDPYSMYLKVDAVLVCSKYEAMGRVVAEAMSALRPVIGYAHSGTSELIEHERTGLLYKADHTDLANCMKRFISDPSWAYGLGLNGWKRGRQRFSIESYAKSVHKIISCVATRKQHI